MLCFARYLSGHTGGRSNWDFWRWRGVTPSGHPNKNKNKSGRSNDVFIGSGKDGVFCDPVPNECTENRIVCLTPAASFLGAKSLTVKSFGQLAVCQTSGGTGCTFKFAASRTPFVTRVVPEWVLAPTQVNVYGSRFTNGDASEGRFDFTMWIGDEERYELQGGR